MSAKEQAQFTIQSLLARGLGATEVARRTGLARASEVWGGDEPLDRPAWYVWLSGVPGAYKLELREAESGQQGGWRAWFTIRYYPSREDSTFERFSAEERAAVLGGLLDSTGTPHIEMASRIPPNLFVVGSLEWASASGSEATVVGLSALDRLLAREESGATIRDVPGWRLGTPLLTTLAGIHAQIDRRTARRILLSRQSGLELVVAGDQFRWRDTDETIQAEVALLFQAPETGFLVGDSLLDGMREPGAHVAADERFAGKCRHPPALEADPRIALKVSHSWFGGEAVAEDRIACAC